MFIITACNNIKLQETKKPLTKEIFAMDTEITLTCYGENAERTLSEAEERIKEIDGLMSTGKADSEISQLNKKGNAKLSNDVYYLIKRAVEISKKTNGAFNPLMYPIMKLWGFDTKRYRIPGEKEIKEKLEFTDINSIVSDENTRKISLKKGMEIDLGGIAKGFTSDELIKIFKKNGVDGLVNLGGNVSVTERKPENKPYKVGIRSPYSGLLGVVTVRDKSVITSGGYERYFEKNGIRYHHIMEPSTGKPANSDLLSVTVISKDGMYADALSTGIFVMGKKTGIAFFKQNHEKFDIILLDKKSKIYVSNGIKNEFISKGFDVEVIKE